MTQPNSSEFGCSSRSQQSSSSGPILSLVRVGFSCLFKLDQLSAFPIPRIQAAGPEFISGGLHQLRPEVCKQSVSRLSLAP